MKTVGSPGDDYAFSIQQTSDGGLIVAGRTNGFGAGGADALLVKFDGSGTIQWAKTAGGTGFDQASSVRQTSDAGYIVAGYTESFTGVGQVLVTKFDGSGAFQWASSLGNPSDSAGGDSVQPTNDGGYIVTGIHAGAIGGLALLKYSSTGQLQWLRRAAGVNHYGHSVQRTADGGFVVTGSKQYGAYGVYDVSLLKFDGSGNLQWAQLAGGSARDEGNAVQQTADGGYVVAGSTASFGAGGFDVFLLKYDSSGTLQWARTAGGGGNDYGSAVQQTSDGGYIVLGGTGSFSTGGFVTLLLKFNSSGVLQWARAGGGSIVSSCCGVTSSVHQTFEGGYVMVGSTTAAGAGGVDVLLIKTDANGNIASCSDWASVSPSIGTSFQSSPASHGNDSPGLSASARALSVVAASLTSNTQCPVAVQVQIDIKPGSYPNSINLGSGGAVPVAIFSSATFDATTVDPLTVTLASAPVKLKGNGTAMSSFQDVNGDGLQDVVVHVSTQTLQLSETDTEAVLEGKTISGVPIRGTDTVRVVP